MAIDHPSPGQIVGRENYTHPVALQHPNLELAHLARCVGQDLMAILQHHTIIAVREYLADNSLHFNAFFFGHPRSPEGFAGTPGRSTGALESCPASAEDQLRARSPRSSSIRLSTRRTSSPMVAASKVSRAPAAL